MKPLLSGWGFWARIASLVVITLLMLIISMVLSFGLGFAIYGKQDVLAQTVPFLQFFQGLTSVFMFVLTALVFALLFDDTNPFRSLTLSSKPKLVDILICVSAIFLTMPLVSWLEDINLAMTLPDCLKPIEDWMRSSEDSAKAVTDKLLGCEGTRCLISNIFVIALIPALGEELFFRGTLQKNILISATGIRPWICVLIAAFVFSAFHLQFFGFLPRFVLGAMLGYMMIVTGNIWCSIICHFVNNASAVLLYDAAAKGAEQQNPQWMETPWAVALSIVLTAAAFYILWRKRDR